jgi:hypothetical protein
VPARSRPARRSRALARPPPVRPLPPFPPQLPPPVTHSKRRPAPRRGWLAQLPAACGLLALMLAFLNFISHPIPATAAAAAAASHRRMAEDAARRRAAAHEWQAAWQRPADRRIAFLHKASDPITLRGVQAAARAKKQVEAAGGWYGFVYSLYPADLPAGSEVPLSERQRITLESLRSALGNSSVFVVGRDQVGARGAQVCREGGGGAAGGGQPRRRSQQRPDGGAAQALQQRPFLPRPCSRAPLPPPPHTPQVVGFLGQQVLDDYQELLTGKLKQKDWAWSTNDVVDVTWWVVGPALLGRVPALGWRLPPGAAWRDALAAGVCAAATSQRRPPHPRRARRSRPASAQPARAPATPPPPRAPPAGTRCTATRCPRGRATCGPSSSTSRGRGTSWTLSA